MIDLSHYSYDEWLDYIFIDLVESEQYSLDEEFNVEMDSRILIDYMTRLFNESDSLIDKYSIEQIDQGFWFIPGPDGFFWVILDNEICWHLRKKCIDSIQFLFQDLFAKYEIGTSCYMWWDSVFTYCTYGNKDILSDLPVIQEIIYVLSKILDQKVTISTKSTIHGVEHLSKLNCLIENDDLNTQIFELTRKALSGTGY